MADIQVYGASWCPDCRRAKKFLAEQRVPFEWFDIQDRPDLVHRPPAAAAPRLLHDPFAVSLESIEAPAG